MCCYKIYELEYQKRSCYSVFRLTTTAVYGDILYFFTGFGVKTKIFRNCVRKDVSRTGNRSQSLLVCAHVLQKQCEMSPLRIIKTIRMDLSAVRSLLDLLPNLKVIYLLRDPRSVLLSQNAVGYCGKQFGGWSGCTNKHCYRVENDVITFENIAREKPERIISVFYEGIAKSPLEATKALYKFVGAECHQQVLDYVYDITMAGHKDNCEVCTVRSNSSAHIDLWKNKMDKQFLEIVENRCHYVLQKFNYNLTNSFTYRY